MNDNQSGKDNIEMRSHKADKPAKSKLGSGKRIAKIAVSAIVCFLPVFMFLIYAPAEAFFANAAELPFVYGEFAGYLAAAAFVSALAAGIILSFLSDKIHRILLALIFALSLCFYVQNMFLNKDLDMMGISATGYSAETGKSILNIIIWIVPVAAVILITMKLKNSKPALFGSVFLLLIQLLAITSLLMNAEDSCFRYPETEYHLSGADQFVVSSDENIIMFVLDSFSDLDLSAALAEDPECLEPFNDFTFYTNMDPVYCGTYPSMTHMLTNNNVNFDLKVNEWTKSAWNSEKADYFYRSMAENDYVCNLYTPDLNLLCGSNPYEDLLNGKITNFTNSPLHRIVDNSLVCKVMVKMSCYKLMPVIAKPSFYVDLNEYMDVVAVEEDPIAHENYDFRTAFQARHLTTDGSHKYFTVQHLMGTHLYNIDREGNYCEGTDAATTALGCLNIVEEYLDEMKRLNVYDKSVIIITADHGAAYGQQPIFFVKPLNTAGTCISETAAPNSFDELLPSIAAFAGLDPSPIGETFDAYKEGDMRERTLYIMDHYDEYPEVKSYYGNKTGTTNVFVGYTYTGDEDELRRYLFDHPSVVIPMVESYF